MDARGDARRIRAVELAVVAILAIAAAVVVLEATAPHGPRVSTDSVYYLSAADSLRAGHGLVSFDGGRMTHYPPGFSTAVAAVGQVAGSASRSARVLNAVCLAAIVLLGWALLRRHVASRVLRIGATVGIAAAPTLFTVSVAAWSEPFFIALVLAAVVVLELALSHRDRWLWMALAGLVAGSTAGLRYSGLWLVATCTGIALLTGRGSLPARRRLRRAAVFLAAASIVPALVVGRNLSIGDDPFGGRGAPNTSVGNALSNTAAGIGRWLVPEHASGTIHAVFVAAAAVSLGLWLFSRFRARGAAVTGRPAAPAQAAPIWPLAALVLGYVAFLALSAATQDLDPIDRRLLSPAFVLAVVLVAAVIDGELRDTALQATWLTPFVVALLAWPIGEVQSTASDYRAIRRVGMGFAQARYRHSPLIAVIRRRHPRPVFTNRIDALFFLTGVRSLCWPTRTATVCNGTRYDVPAAPHANGALLAWFADAGRARPDIPIGVPYRVRLVPVELVRDGGLYKVLIRR